MKIIVVAGNYAPLAPCEPTTDDEHNKMLARALYKKVEPVVFTKADSTLLKNHKPFFLPDWTSRVDYEAHLVVRISRLGKSIPVRFAHRYYDAVTVGIDFTARHLLEQARREGLPWTMGKEFDGSTVIGDWQLLPPAVLPDRCDAPSLPAAFSEHRFRLDVNGITVQQARTGDLRWSVDELTSYVSRFFTLKTGDLLFTGTPPGWGPAHIDDHLEGWLGDKKVLDFHCK